MNIKLNKNKKIKYFPTKSSFFSAFSQVTGPKIIKMTFTKIFSRKATPTLIFSLFPAQTKGPVQRQYDVETEADICRFCGVVSRKWTLVQLQSFGH